MEELLSVKRKLCKVCGNYKDIKYFWSKKDDGSIVMDKCRICTNKLRRLKRKSEGEHRSYLALTGVRDIDFIETFQFLKSIGYDLEKDIHLQFCEKYNLTPIEYTGIARKLSPKELGLT